MASGPLLFGLELGDWATWVSAVGTVGALFAAINLARADLRRKQQENYARGTVVAAILFIEISYLAMATKIAIEKLENAKNSDLADCLFNIREAMEALKIAKTTNIESNLEKLFELPPRHAVSIASMPQLHRSLINYLERIFKVPEPDLKALFENVMPQLRVTQDRISDFMSEYEKKFMVQ